MQAMRILLGLSLILAASVASAQNLVTNGDFSLGNVGFSTEYGYVAPATDALVPASVYTLTADTRNPYVLNTQGDGIVGYNDHTTGRGLFMAANGSTTFNALVWGQTLSGLTVGQSYRFGMWISRWTPSNAAPAKLQVLAGATLVGTFGDPSVPGVWESRSGLFTAASTSVALQIRSLEDAAFGNDFGLDDLSVQAVPEPGTWAVVGLGLLGVRRTRRR